MEIIDTLEQERRGFYAGCIGYFSGNGNMDTAIALRTGLVKDGKLYVQAGGGIVEASEAMAANARICPTLRMTTGQANVPTTKPTK